MTLAVTTPANTGNQKESKTQEQTCLSHSQQNKHIARSFFIQSGRYTLTFFRSVSLAPLLISSFSFKFNEKNLSLHIFCRFYNLNMKFFIRRMVRVAKSLFAFVCFCFLFQLRFHHLLCFLSLLFSFLCRFLLVTIVIARVYCGMRFSLFFFGRGMASAVKRIFQFVPF